MTARTSRPPPEAGILQLIEGNAPARYGVHVVGPRATDLAVRARPRAAGGTAMPLVTTCACWSLSRPLDRPRPAFATCRSSSRRAISFVRPTPRRCFGARYHGERATALTACGATYSERFLDCLSVRIVLTSSSNFRNGRPGSSRPTPASGCGSPGSTCRGPARGDHLAHPGSRGPHGGTVALAATTTRPELSAEMASAGPSRPNRVGRRPCPSPRLHTGVSSECHERPYP